MARQNFGSTQMHTFFLSLCINFILEQLLHIRFRILCHTSFEDSAIFVCGLILVRKIGRQIKITHMSKFYGDFMGNGY